MKRRLATMACAAGAVLWIPKPGLAEAAAAPLRCPTVLSAPIVDGLLNEPAWRGAPILLEDGVSVKGIIVHDTLFLGAELSQPEIDHLDCAVTDDAHTVIYRVVLGPGGPVHTAKQTTPDGGQTWITDKTWSSRAAVHADRIGRRWTAELAVPLTKGFVLCQLKSGQASPTPHPWHPIRSEDNAPVSARPQQSSASNASALKDLSDDELITLAARQVDDPQIAARTVRLDEVEDALNRALMDDATWTAEHIRPLVEELHQLRGENPPTPRMIDRQMSRSQAIRPLIASMGQLMQKESFFRKTLFTAASYPAFVQSMKEQYGDHPFERMPQPGTNYGVMGDSGVRIGPWLKHLPESWDNLTEDQFREARAYLLRPSTPAGIEFLRRRHETPDEQARRNERLSPADRTTASSSTIAPSVSLTPVGPRLLCTVSPLPIDCDGALKERVWKDTPAVIDGPVVLKGVLRPEGAVLGLDSVRGEVLSAPQHITVETVNLAGTDRRRLAVTCWPAELPLALQEGAVRININSSPSPAVWHLVGPAFEGRAASATTGSSASTPLTLIASDLLPSLADAEAEQSEFLDRAMKMAQLDEQFLELFLNDSLTVPDMKAAMKRYWQDVIPEFVEHPVLIGVSASLDDPAIDAQLKEKMKVLRPVLEAFTPTIKRRTDLYRSLLTTSSFGDFVHAMRERHGQDAFQGLQTPGASWVGGMDLHSTIMGRSVGDPPMPFPKRWEDLTAEQFRVLQQYERRRFTKAGFEWSLRHIIPMLTKPGPKDEPAPSQPPRNAPTLVGTQK